MTLDAPDRTRNRLRHENAFRAGAKAGSLDMLAAALAVVPSDLRRPLIAAAEALRARPEYQLVHRRPRRRERSASPQAEAAPEPEPIMGGLGAGDPDAGPRRPPPQPISHARPLDTPRPGCHAAAPDDSAPGPCD